MASVLPFNKVTKGGSTLIASSEFATGRGNLQIMGSDIRPVTTADGKIHNVRFSVDRRTVFQTYGDTLSSASSVTTNTTLGDTSEVIALYYDSTKIYERRGVVSGKYDAGSHMTTLEILFDSELPA